MKKVNRIKIVVVLLFATFMILGLFNFADSKIYVQAQEKTVSVSPTPFDQKAALAKLNEQIKGKENEPAENVFKNIQTLKGVPAGRLLRIMEMGYARSLGVDCTHCHTPEKWETEDKSTKQIAREMVSMVNTLNGQTLKNIKNLNEKATINCTTCHRGEVKPALNLPTPTSSDTNTKTEKTFSEESKKLDEESSKQVPPKVLEAGKKGIEELIAAGIVKNALNVGDKMPKFTLTDANDKKVSNKDLLKKGHLVVTFYRGAWCPFCNLYLRSLQKRLPEFQKLGANLVAISVEPPDRSLNVSQQNQLDFTVLSDPQLVVSKKFGIVYEMPKVTNDAVLELGFDIAKYNGMEKAELPLSATYIINKKGKIVYAFLEPDYKKRAEPNQIIAELEKLKKGGK